MKLASEKNIDDDPRPYVKALRQFAAESGIALAEGSLRYGRLWRQGIPYSTLMMNSINHPNRLPRPVRGRADGAFSLRREDACRTRGPELVSEKRAARRNGF
jgi:hypothetical protein